MHTITDSTTGLVRVINDTPRTDPQAFTVYVKDAKDWKEIHDYIIYENNLDDIPNRQISVVSELEFSPKRSIYSMSEDEADVLRNHPKVGLVTYSSMHNPVVLEQRKYDEEFDNHLKAFRFQDTFNSTKFYDSNDGEFQTPTDCKTEHISHWRRKTNLVVGTTGNSNQPQGTSNQFYSGLSNPVGLGSTNPGVGLTFTQWGLLRHSYKENPFKAGYPGSVNGSVDNEIITDKDIAYSLTGKNVDVVIMDSGVVWNHPEFLLPGITTISTYKSTADSEGNIYDASTEWVKPYTRVRDILLDGKADFGINWEAEGLVSAGSTTLVGYARSTVLGNSPLGNSQISHGTHVASIAAGNVFGWAPEANIWSIACVRSGVGFADPGDGFDYIKVWHKKKPINPVTGRKNPTIVNCSWGTNQYVLPSLNYTATFRGTTYTKAQIDADSNAAPAISNIDMYDGNWMWFESKDTTSQVAADELYEDPDCKDIILVTVTGNSGTKQDLPLAYGGDGDYDNKFTSGTFAIPTADTYYHRIGTPAITGIGNPDAPIKVGSIDVERNGNDTTRVGTSGTFAQERISHFSNRGPACDILAAGEDIWGAYWALGSYRDPRRPLMNSDAKIYEEAAIVDRANWFTSVPSSGTSMAAPQVTGVIAQKLQADPSMNRIDVRNWLMSEGSVMLDDQEFWGGRTGSALPFTPEDAVGINSAAYWKVSTASHRSYVLMGNNTRILFNPYSNNSQASIKGVNISGVSITQL